MIMYNCTLNIIVMGCKKSFLDNSKLLIIYLDIFGIKTFI